MAEFDAVANFATELRKWWSFNDRQHHTHGWHDREDFIEKVLPRLLATARLEGEISEAMVEAAAMPLCIYEKHCPDGACRFCMKKARAALKAASEA